MVELVTAAAFFLLSSFAGEADHRERPADCPELACEQTVTLAGESCPRCSLSCETDHDCTTTRHPRVVASKSDCYCLPCAVLMNREIADLLAESWQRSCASEWEEAAGCAEPMCARPLGKPACKNRRCTYLIDESPKKAPSASTSSR